MIKAIHQRTCGYPHYIYVTNETLISEYAFTSDVHSIKDTKSFLFLIIYLL